MTFAWRPTAASAPDKPDLRFGLEIEDATEVTRGSEFGVFAGAEARALPRACRGRSRAPSSTQLEEFAKQWGAKGLAYLVYDEEGEVRSPIAKFLGEAELAAVRADPATTVLFAADEPGDGVSRVLGALRAPPRPRARTDRRELRSGFVWITDFPMFEWDADDGRWTTMHHRSRAQPRTRRCSISDPGSRRA